MSCALVLTQAGYALGLKESSRGALEVRRGGEIIIVTHHGAGLFDPLSEHKDDVFSLARRIDQLTFSAVFERLRALDVVEDPVPFRAPARRADPMPPTLRCTV